MFVMFRGFFDAVYTTTLSFFLAPLLALPYGIYRLVRKDKPKPQRVKVDA